MSPTPVTRRELALSAARATAALAFPAIVPASVLGARAPSKRVALAHVGVGGRGGGLLDGFRGLPECRVVAVSDCYRSRREGHARATDAAYGAAGCKAYADFRDLCADPAIDAVVVATPDHWHVPAALEAIRHGKHIYVEKPLGVSIEQDLVLRDAVRRYGVVFQYGTQQRSMPHMRWACEMVRGGRLGKLRAVEITCPANVQGGSTTPATPPADLDYEMYLGPAPATPYTIDRCTSLGSYHIFDFAVGFIGGWGAHPLDIMLWGLGDGPDAVPVEYTGSATWPTSGLFDTPLTWDVRGRFADGKRFRFTAPGSDMTVFIGDRGRIEVGRGGFGRIEPASLRNEKPRPGEPRLTVSDNHGSNFLEAIRSGTPAVTSADSACWSDLVSHLSDISLRTGRTIRWDPSKAAIVGDPAAARLQHRPMRAPWRLK